MKYRPWLWSAFFIVCANAWIIVTRQNAEQRVAMLLPQTTVLLLLLVSAAALVFSRIRISTKTPIAFGTLSTALLVLCAPTLAMSLEPTLRPWILAHQQWSLIRLFGSYLAAYLLLFVIAAVLSPFVSSALRSREE